MEPLRMEESVAKIADLRLIEPSAPQEIRLSRSRLVRLLLISAGSLCIFFAFIGVILPILPTTPFLLLAAACFAHSSERAYAWMLNNRLFGHYIRDWRAKKGISLATKVWAITVLVLTLGASIVFFVPLASVKVSLAIVGLCVSAYIWRLPTKEAVPSES